MLRQLALAAFATALIAPPVHAQDYTLAPTFGVFSVQSGFMPDTNWISVLAGGDIRGEYTDHDLGVRCAGYFADAPRFPCLLHARLRRASVLLRRGAR